MFQHGASELVQSRTSPRGYAFLCALIGLAVALPLSLAHGQSTQKSDRDVLQIVTEILGEPAYAMDGARVGEVTDIYFDESGDVAKVRISAASHLGLGVRTIELPRTAFRLVRGTVIVDLPPDAIGDLPAIAEKVDER
jgi:sporulation protein YlmC with PRC-barrel domain